MSRCTFVRVDPEALIHNIGRVKYYAPKSRILAMVKSNGYGHGIVRVAKALCHDADAFGVACLEEAITLRKADITQPLVLMSGFFSPEELSLISQWKLEVVVHYFRQLEILEKTRLEKPVRIWLKLDTGMHRLGFLPAEFQETYERLMKNLNIEKPFRFITHFSDSDCLEKKKTQQQIDLFYQTVQGLAEEKSLANSAGILHFPSSHADWVRPGLMLYGASPLSDRIGEDYGLKPVMTFYSRLTAVRYAQKGDDIGYGSSWRCPENMPVGIVPVGYGDGYPRTVHSERPILVGERLCQIVGRVSMDMLVVDLRNAPLVSGGERVTLWGEGLPVEKVAESVGRIPYELLCGITRRVHGSE